MVNLEKANLNKPNKSQIKYEVRKKFYTEVALTHAAGRAVPHCRAAVVIEHALKCKGHL